MMLTPKARRFIGDAVRSLPPGSDRDLWRAWNEGTKTGEATSEVLRVAHAALTNLERHMFSTLDTTTDEDDRVDLMNDLAFVRAVLRGVADARQPAHA